MFFPRWERSRDQVRSTLGQFIIIFGDYMYSVHLSSRCSTMVYSSRISEGSATLCQPPFSDVPIASPAVHQAYSILAGWQRTGRMVKLTRRVRQRPAAPHVVERLPFSFSSAALPLSRLKQHSEFCPPSTPPVVLLVKGRFMKKLKPDAKIAVVARESPDSVIR